MDAVLRLQMLPVAGLDGCTNSSVSCDSTASCESAASCKSQQSSAETQFGF